MQRRTLLKAFALSASVAAMGMSFGVQAADTIKVGIMHSLSGTMAISETPLKDHPADRSRTGRDHVPSWR